MLTPTGEIYLKNDNSAEVLEHLKTQIQTALMACGTIAEGYAKDDCPVDTGRMRNSITWAIKGEQGQANNRDKEHAYTGDYAKLAEPEDGTLYIGTNVEYAPEQELRSMSHRVGKAHFLRDSIANHGDEFKEHLEAALKA